MADPEATASPGSAPGASPAPGFVLPTYRRLMWVLNGLFNSIWRVKVFGREHFPPPGRPVIVALLHHSSSLDVFVMGVAVQRPMYFLTKAETFRIPILGSIFGQVGGIPANRDGQDLPALRRMLSVLVGDNWLAVAPEGTRSHDGGLLPYDPGFLWLAQKSGALVLPAVLWGADKLMPRAARIPRPGPIEVHFFPPRDYSAFGRLSRDGLADQAAELRNWTQAQLDILDARDSG